MKKLIVAVIFLCSFVLVLAQDPIKAKLDGLGVKSPVVKDNPAAKIKKMYTFNEGGIKGGIIVVTLAEIQMDVFITLIQSGTVFTVKSAEAVNATAYNKNMMAQLKDSFSKWNNVQEKNIPDAVTSATKHSKGIYLEIRDAVTVAIALLKK